MNLDMERKIRRAYELATTSHSELVKLWHDAENKAVQLWRDAEDRIQKAKP